MVTGDPLLTGKQSAICKAQNTDLKAVVCHMSTSHGHDVICQETPALDTSLVGVYHHFTIQKRVVVLWPNHEVGFAVSLPGWTSQLHQPEKINRCLLAHLVATDHHIKDSQSERKLQVMLYAARMVSQNFCTDSHSAAKALKNHQHSPAGAQTPSTDEYGSDRMAHATLNGRSIHGARRAWAGTRQAAGHADRQAN